MKHSFFFLIIAIVLSCGKQTNKSLEKVAMNTQTTSEQLQKEGYTPGKIRKLENSSCTYVIVLSESDIRYDPINIEDEKYRDFKQDGLDIFFKYRLLRMANRCEEAQPVELEDIKKGS